MLETKPVRLSAVLLSIMPDHIAGLSTVLSKSSNKLLSNGFGVGVRKWVTMGVSKQVSEYVNKWEVSQQVTELMRMSKLQRYVERLNKRFLSVFPPSSEATEPPGSRLGPGYPAAARPSGTRGQRLQSWCECRAWAVVNKSPAVTDVLEHWT